jgi:hypothetical protein
MYSTELLRWARENSGKTRSVAIFENKIASRRVAPARSSYPDQVGPIQLALPGSHPAGSELDKTEPAACLVAISPAIP